MKSLTELAPWQTLAKHHHEIANQHMRDWFAKDPERFDRFSLASGEIFLDYSRNRLNSKTIKLLCDLATAMQLSPKIEAQFTGFPINHTEKRPALHTALRDKNHTPLRVKGENIALLITQTQEKIRDFVIKIQTKTWKGVTGKPIAHIVNLGIGGSHHGPMMSTHALKNFAVTDLQFHFISSVDKAGLDEVLEKIDPYSTLFIISSKSFTTLETLTNAHTILAWMKAKLGEKAVEHHFVAITSAMEKAMAFGIPEDHIFPIWEWVGGRYSIWSAMGLPLNLMIGNDNFSDFLDGAYQMDQHFRHTHFSENMPVLLALFSIWYTNFFDAHAQAIVPYSYRLRHLVPYLQQADMESSGKSASIHHHPIQYATGPIIFGEEGCNGQHTYHQLLHQGRHLIPVDFILIGKANKAADDYHQDAMIASGLSQAQALMRGKTYDEAHDELIALKMPHREAKDLAYHQMIPGNRPSNILFLERLTPKNLGALLALYEHKIFVQGIIWNINSFDQWGVELGKQLLPKIMEHLHQPSSEVPLDCATAGLIDLYKKAQGRK